MYNPSRRIPKYIDPTLVSSYIRFATHERFVKISMCNVILHISKAPFATINTPSLSNFHI
jgi:hypothetical protein